jgi:hypothetical protein
MSTEINIKKRITALDESVILTKDLNSINFVGAGVVASAIAEDVTVTIGGGIAGSGTTNYLSKWTAATTLGNSQTQDDGANIAVNGAILSSYKFAVYSTTPGENYNIYGNTTVNGAVGVAGVNQGVGASTNYGAGGTAQSSTTQNIGVYGQATGASVENVGGKFSATLATSNYSVQLQDGTEGIGKVLTSMTADGKAQWATPAGLTYFTEAQNTTAPNATVPVDSLTAVTATTNGDVAIVPKGTGAFTLAVADSLVAGGNKRGANAIDLQSSRTVNSQVALGTRSFTAGSNNTASADDSVAIGRGNVASAFYSVAIGLNSTASGSYANAFGFLNLSSGQNSFSNGYGNTASAAYAIALGNSNTANNTGTVALGYGNTSSGNLSYTFGSSCTASNANAIAMGNRAKATGDSSICLASYFYADSTASGANSIVIGYGTASSTRSVAIGFQASVANASSTAIGDNANTFNTAGRIALSGGNLSGTSGDNQKGIISYRQRTTDATPTILTTNNSTTFNDNTGAQLGLQNQQVMRFKGSITAKKSGTTDIAVWDIDGVLVRGANAASTVLTVGNVNVVTNIPAWVTPTLAANTSVNVGGLLITITGVVATNIQWFAVLDTVENIYA